MFTEYTAYSLRALYSDFPEMPGMKRLQVTVHSKVSLAMQCVHEPKKKNVAHATAAKLKLKTE